MTRDIPPGKHRLIGEPAVVTLEEYQSRTYQKIHKHNDSKMKNVFNNDRKRHQSLMNYGWLQVSKHSYLS